MIMPTHQFDCLVDAFAWLCGYRHLTKKPMDRWFQDLRAWRDGDKLILSLPLGIIGHAVASLPLSATDGMTDQELIDNLAFAEAWCGKQAAFVDVGVKGNA
jgi:hypothetical protein